jgi:predicted GNAT family N-acyltransferase
MFERWLRVISEGNGASPSAKRRNSAKLLRKIMSEAQSEYKKKIVIIAEQCHLVPAQIQCGLRTDGKKPGSRKKRN